MEIMMEMMDSTLSADLQVDESALEKMEAGLVEEVAGQEAAAFDREIEDGLRKIRAELEKPGK
jgi:hypothetical protein